MNDSLAGKHLEAKEQIAELTQNGEKTTMGMRRLLDATF
jgi:hypothetical protein